MKLEITDRQYLWWDDVFTNHMGKALSYYENLIFRHSSKSRQGCLRFGIIPRAKIRFNDRVLTGYRFAYGVATVIPLSDMDVIRHECDNPFCVNPRHLMVGDQKDNFRDYQAMQAYGTRWELLAGWHSM